MENNILNYKSKRGIHVPGDVKEYILKRVKEGAKTLKEIAAEHGISVSAISSWLKADVGGVSDSSFLSACSTSPISCIIDE